MFSAISLQSAHPHRELLAFIRSQYPGLDSVPLHTPVLGDLEKQALNDCIDSDFVSSVGPAITEFEQQIAAQANAKHAIAVVNGTAALQLALHVVGVNAGTEVVTQAFTFVGTANAISHCGAEPVFVDINRKTLSLCPTALRRWLENNSRLENGRCINKYSGKIISACIVMHSFGHPARLQELLAVCDEFQLALIEDAAEALASRYFDKPVGAQGRCGIFSFNGNKIITTGGGGVLVTNDSALAGVARHLATTAKLPHPWHFYHDQVGFNFRLPNLNASLGLAQLQRLEAAVATKRELADNYRRYCDQTHFEWIAEPTHCQSNYWLNAILCRDQGERDALLQLAHDQAVLLRPSWQPLSDSRAYRHCQRGDLATTCEIAARLVNLPSGVAGSVYA